MTVTYFSAPSIEAMNAAAQHVANELLKAGIAASSVCGASDNVDAAVELGNPNLTVCVSEQSMHLSVFAAGSIRFCEERTHDDISGLVLDISANHDA